MTEPTVSQITPGDVERVCHEEQLRVWASDLIGALSMGDYIRDDMSYDDGLDLERIVMREIKSVVASAFGHPERNAA